MKPYLDTEDTFYFNYEELIKAPKIITNLAELKAELDPKQKSKRDYAFQSPQLLQWFFYHCVSQDESDFSY